MSWNGEEYSRRLEELSNDTMRLISEFNTIENILKITEIVMTNKSEKKIVEDILKLKK